MCTLEVGEFSSWVEVKAMRWDAFNGERLQGTQGREEEPTQEIGNLGQKGIHKSPWR